jgi:hypothetical protein
LANEKTIHPLNSGLAAGGHVVDLMNQRLDAPFTEVEVLKIFSDLTVAVFACHHAKPVRRQLLFF